MRLNLCKNVFSKIMIDELTNNINDDFINQMTLKFLISKNQLTKLNKNIQQTQINKRTSDIIKYKTRINELFHDLLNNNIPDDLLSDVQTTFNIFVNKSIYYFKAHDTCIHENYKKINGDNDTYDNDNFEKEQHDIENGNYIETNNTTYDDNNDDILILI